jgi:hypothetical protein
LSKLFRRGFVARQTLGKMFKDKVGNGLRYKHIYLCHVDKYIGAYNPYTGEVVGYEISNKFVPFVQKILHDFPDYSPHNVINEGIKDEIRKKILMDIAKRELQKNRD